MIRRKLSSYETISTDVKPYKELFLGGVNGVVLRPRGKKDDHVVFEIIREDDGHWFPIKGSHSSGKTSSTWFEDLESVLRTAREWCEENCDPDISDNGIQYGYKFRYKRISIRNQLTLRIYK